MADKALAGLEAMAYLSKILRLAIQAEPIFVQPQEQVLKVGTKSLFQSDITKVDTVYVGDFTFPLCYFGTGISNITQASYAPYIRINSRATGKPNVSPYDRNLRIDYIMLVPKDLDNYIKEHPGYKYQNLIIRI